MLDKVENRLKLLLRLPLNVQYYAQTFNVLLYSGSRVSD
jgi:hypothetical protein